MNPKMTTVRRVAPAVFLIFVFVLTFVFGLSVGQADGVPGNFSTYKQVWELIKKQYVNGPVDEQKLYYDSIKGLVLSLGDPYSAFYEPEAAKISREDGSGVIGGIGVDIVVKDHKLIITSILPGSPAEKAGLHPGDVVSAIDGTKVEGLTFIELTNRVRGQKGTPVTLTISRTSFPEPLDVTMVREDIRRPSVKTEMIRKDGRLVSIITLRNFDLFAAKEFLGAVKETLDAKADAVIVDLRGNPGGDLNVAGQIAGVWLSRQVFMLVRLVDRAEGLPATGIGQFRNMPTVVLVNHGSASAAEVLAAALRDYGKARIIGEKTYGKGCGQSLIDFPDGSELLLTTFFWFSPEGRSVEKVGLTPDETVPLTQEDRDQGRDPQLDRALEFLTAGH